MWAHLMPSAESYFHWFVCIENMPRVIILRPGPDDVKRCLDFMAVKSLTKGKRVLIKPNLTTNMSANTGVTTHPRLVSAAAEYIRKSGAEEVVIGEGSATRVRPSYENLGFLDFAKDLGVRVVDFWEDELVEVQVPNPLSMKSFQIASTVLESDFILNIPVMKIHSGESQVTLCAKNMMGCIAREKGFMHTEFNARIIDLLKIVRPNVNIVDGIVGMETEEIEGRPVGANVIVAGKDFVAVDLICSQIMGFSPGEVKHIKMAEEHGFGCADPSVIEVQGLNPMDVTRPFEKARM